MIKRMNRLALALCALMFFTNSVQAGPAATEDITGIFCDAMQDEQQYNTYGYESYKMLTPGKEGWIFRSESDFRTDFSITDEALDRLVELNRAFRKRGTELVIIKIPTRSMMHYEFLTEQDRKKYGIENIDAVWKSYWDSIEKIKGKGINVVGIDRRKPGEPFYYKRDHHWNPDGSKFAAQKLAEYIKDLPAYADVKKIEYKTADMGSYEFEGVSKKVFSQLCKTVQPPENIHRYVTERTDTSAAQQDLFGETVNPEIVLLGTSNSTMIPSYANFEGFLREALGADILNMSVSGGGMDTAMISYLNSPFFQESPAKIAIWEIPGNYDISQQKNFFREAVPAVYGSCEKPVEFADDNIITSKNLLIFNGIRKKKIGGDDYYLNLTFDGPVAKSFTVDMRYQSGRDRYKFYRSSRTPNDNQFFLELVDAKNLEKVVLYLPASLIEHKLDAKLCKKSTGSGFFASFDDDGEPNSREGVKGLLHKLRTAIKF